MILKNLPNDTNDTSRLDTTPLPVKIPTYRCAHTAAAKAKAEATGATAAAAAAEAAAAAKQAADVAAKGPTARSFFRKHF